MVATQTRILPRRQLRSLFVSDLHLGARGSRAADFLRFLQETEAETIYLVGDILDIWHIGTVHWSATHDAILAELKTRARDGVRVVYLPGNHDVAMKRYYGAPCDGFELAESVIHEAADGQRYLVLHGDQCDARIFRWHVMTRIGSRADAALRATDAWLRRQLHLTRERGIIEAMISGVNTLMTIGNGFEARLIALARGAGLDGVICGHFHKAALHETEGLLYANCGDWVDSLTALAEGHDGALRMLQWVPVAAPETLGELRPAAEGTS
ncbi:MAG: UDP-2,3-diacylglucosamine diphosphatase [Sphingomonadales bacterium]|nr:UDP-2,3-diacylglucosamine diphosphatase [Sphingomonadales bacterium]